MPQSVREFHIGEWSLVTLKRWDMTSLIDITNRWIFCSITVFGNRAHKREVCRVHQMLNSAMITVLLSVVAMH